MYQGFALFFMSLMLMAMPAAAQHPPSPSQFVENARPAARGMLPVEEAMFARYKSSNTIPWGLWSEAVPVANRALLRCIGFKNEMNPSTASIRATLTNWCPFALRIEVEYGEWADNRCQVLGRLNGVMLASGPGPFAGWSIDARLARPGCIAMIHSFGIPDWTHADAQAAAAWLVERARIGQVGIWAVIRRGPEVGGVKTPLAFITFDGPCTATLHAPVIPPTGQSTVRIEWGKALESDYNQYQHTITFSRADSRFDWWFHFWLEGGGPAGAPGPRMVHTLVEYCRAQAVNTGSR